MANEVALTDIGTILYYRKAGTAAMEKLVGITGAPDMGSEPESQEVTETDSQVRQFVGMRASADTLTFTYNYLEDNFDKVNDLDDGSSHEFALVFSDGSGYYINGTIKTWTNSFESNSNIDATFSITQTTGAVWYGKTGMDAILANTPSA